MCTDLDVYGPRSSDLIFTLVVAGLTGVRTVDVGSPQWAMHSVRECMATSDVYHGYVRRWYSRIYFWNRP